MNKMPSAGKNIRGADADSVYQARLGLRHSGFEYAQKEIICVDGCIDCLYFHRFDICAPEYSTAILDIYIEQDKSR